MPHRAPTDGDGAGDGGLLLGLLVLSHEPSSDQLAGIALVILAGASDQRGGRGSAPDDGEPEQILLPLTDPEPT